MFIYTAEVTSDMDYTRHGVVQVKCVDEPRITEVIYTTPYFNPFFKGGMFAPPANESKILVTYDIKNNKAYYLTTIVDSGSKYVDDKAEASAAMRTAPVVPNPLDLYEDLAPASMTFLNDEDNGLSIINRNSPTRMVNETVLNNGRKHLSLISSPESDGVVLDNGHGDWIKINGAPKSAVGQPTTGSRNVQIKSLLGQQYVTHMGGIDISVTDGKDINIQNTSTGWWTLGGLFGPRSGNVNLFSKYATVRLSAKGVEPTPQDGGSVLIETATANVLVSNNAITIRMDSGGEIEINGTNGAITLTSLSAITLDAPKISLNAADSIDMTAESINIGNGDTKTVNIYSSEVVNIDGPDALNLNTESASEADPDSALPGPNNVLLAYLKTEYPSGNKYI